MLRKYSNIYSTQEVMAKRLCFSAAMVTFAPITLIMSVNAPKSKPITLSGFSDLQIAELEAYLSSYTEKPYVITVAEEIYVVIPSMYPSSTSCLLLRMDMQPSAFLRFVRDRAEFFTLSKDISTLAARMSPRLDAQKKDFTELCAEIENVFMGMERFNLSFDDEDIVDGYYEQTLAISNFFGVPIDDITVDYDGNGVLSQNSLASFTAFCSTVMMLAKNDAVDRKLSVNLSFEDGMLTVSTSFRAEKPIKLTNETFLWDYLSSVRKMHFEYYSEGNQFFVKFQPIFWDWSYLEMKQSREMVQLFEK